MGYVVYSPLKNDTELYVPQVQYTAEYENKL